MNFFKRGLPYIASAAFMLAACESDRPITHKVNVNESTDIELKSRTIKTDSLEAISSEVKDKISNAEGRIHVMLQYDRNLTQEEKKNLASDGIKILSPISSKTYYASVPAGINGLEGKLNSNPLRYAGDILPEDKISPNIGKMAPWSKGKDIVGVNVTFHKDIKPAKMISKISALGGTVNSTLDTIKLAKEMGLLASTEDAISMANITVSEDKFQELVESLGELDEVEHVEYATIPFSELNFNGRRISMVNALQEEFPDLDGTGTKVAVYDSGLIYEHPDYEGRVKYFTCCDEYRKGSGHASHVAGTVAGDGSFTIEGLEDICDSWHIYGALKDVCKLFNASEDKREFEGMFRGVAPKAHILSMFHGPCIPYCYYNVPNNLLVKFAHAGLEGVDLLTSSTGSNVSGNGYPCEFNGDYESSAALVDFMIKGPFGLSPLAVLFAAGNERGYTRCFMEGDEIGYATIGIPATSKNAIKVGATMIDENGYIALAYYSSFGPTDDGRMGITVVNYGGGGDIGVISVGSNYSYGVPYASMSGTSMAAPLTAGVGLLLNQRYSDRHLGDISPHLLKALLAGTAWDIGPYYADYQSGFGHVDAAKAEEAVRMHRFMEGDISETGGYDLYNLKISNPWEPIKVTMAYTDVMGSLNSARNLVNDLDIVLVSPDGRVIKPMVLDPTHPEATAQEGEDHINNIEQVVYHLSGDDIDNKFVPWQILVKGYDVVDGPVDYAIVTNQSIVDAPSYKDFAKDEAMEKVKNYPFLEDFKP
ncbi:MAG: S8 family serine peptidase [Candidatus Woesearchaeota archaeon]